jgi:hypothetical protein
MFISDPDQIRIRPKVSAPCGSGSGSGSATLMMSEGSGSGRPKNMWIRIHNTGVDTVDQGDEGRGHVHASHAGPQAEGDPHSFLLELFSGSSSFCELFHVSFRV